MATTMTRRGQVTIPKPVRDKLNLHAGDKLEFVLDPDGEVRLIPVTASVKELKGLVPRPKRALSLEVMVNTKLYGKLKQWRETRRRASVGEAFAVYRVIAREEGYELEIPKRRDHAVVRSD